MLCKIKDKNKLILTLILIISIIGIFLGATLTAAKYNDKIAILCGEDSGNSCNTVQNSEFSNIINIKNQQTGQTKFQVPKSLAGLFYYLSTLILTIFISVKYKKTKTIPKNYQYSLLILTTIGVCASIIFILIQTFLIKAFCTYCILSAIDTLLLLFLSIAFLFYNFNK